MAWCDIFRIFGCCGGYTQCEPKIESASEDFVRREMGTWNVTTRASRYADYESRLDYCGDHVDREVDACLSRLYVRLGEAGIKVPASVEVSGRWGNLLRQIVWDCAVYGDCFIEVVEKLMVQRLPVETVYRIETIRGKLLEFQQSLSGPDYDVLSGVTSDGVVRFDPSLLVHVRIEDSRKRFYPYGCSILEGNGRIDSSFDDCVFNGVCELVRRLS